MGRRDPSYRELNDNWLTSYGVFPAILYDVFAFPFHFWGKRQRLRLRAEQAEAQTLKRQSRRARRASAGGTKRASSQHVKHPKR